MFHNNISPENPDIIHGGGAAFRYTHPPSACGGPSAGARSPVSSARGPANHESEQDRLLPIANVGRIMKKILPAKAKISKEAKETMQECVSEFISFVTCEASDKCHKEKRKTVNGDDICWALENLGFDEYSESLKRYLGKYREAEGEKGNYKNKGSGNEDRDESWPSDDRGDHPTVRMQGVCSSTLPFNFYI